MKDLNGNEVVISEDIKQLSNEGLLSIIRNHSHVSLLGDESREELEAVLQININEDMIDEIEVIIVLSGD